MSENVTGYVTLYLDESGGKGWPEPWGKNPDAYYVLAGPVMTPDQDRKAHERIPEILDEFFPGLAPRPGELRYGDLINQRGAFEGVSGEQRKALADKVWDLILALRPTLMGSVVNKAIMKERYGPNANPPNEYAMRATIERFDIHLQETENIGMAIMDTDSLDNDRALRVMVHKARTEGIKIMGVNYMPMSNRRLKYILNSVTFTPSEMSPGVQLADFIAYATFSHFQREKSTRYNQIDPLWRRSGSHREPSVIPRKQSP